MKLTLVKREEASEMVLTIIIWAIISMLGTRLYLKLSGYPIIGFGEWHLAHVLDGGMMMVVGMLTIISLNGSRARKWAAVIFGIGTGRFIDETGKFISKDNNYFFQPAIMLIYVFFIVLFLVYRYLEKVNPKDPKALLYWVIEQMEDVAEGDLSETEKKRMLKKMKEVTVHTKGNVHEFAIEFNQLVKKLPVSGEEKLGLGEQMWKRIKTFSYHRVFKKKFVLWLLLILSLGYVISTVSDVAFLLERFRHVNLDRFIYYDIPDGATRNELNLFTFMAISNVGTAVMFILGIVWVVRKKRRRGIGFFQYGLLTYLLLTSVLRFYFEQLVALQGLAVTLVVYMGLDRFKKELES